MTTFLLRYSDSYDARKNGYPLAGSPVEIETLADLDALMERLGGNDLILRPATDAYQAAWWAEYHDIRDEDDHRDDYAIGKLPENWREMRWIEVYNGRRE